jgi:hypothetical protein
MSNVIPLGNITRLDLPPDRILEGAKERLESVVIIGYTNEGEEYFASSIADGGTVLWLMEKFKMRLLEAEES